MQGDFFKLELKGSLFLAFLWVIFYIESWFLQTLSLLMEMDVE